MVSLIQNFLLLKIMFFNLEELILRFEFRKFFISNKVRNLGNEVSVIFVYIKHEFS
jgi:hypothetical protein